MYHLHLPVFWDQPDIQTTSSLVALYVDDKWQITDSQGEIEVKFETKESFEVIWENSISF